MNNCLANIHVLKTTSFKTPKIMTYNSKDHMFSLTDSLILQSLIVSSFSATLSNEDYEVQVFKTREIQI